MSSPWREANLVIIFVPGDHGARTLAMSSGSTIALSVGIPAAGADDDDAECRACYGVAVACVSQLLFSVLAATAGVVEAGAVTGFTLLFFGVIGWFVHAGGSRTTAPPAAAGSAAGCTCAPVGAAAADVPPAFAYEGGALCAVCLEDVGDGEVVRRLPACGHVFHVECVDMWLRSHSTCPRVPVRRPLAAAGRREDHGGGRVGRCVGVAAGVKLSNRNRKDVAARGVHGCSQFFF
ncbi:hypothetical protein ACP4OV_009193 [Aristida adscensionis]